MDPRLSRGWLATAAVVVLAFSTAHAQQTPENGPPVIVTPTPPAAVESPGNEAQPLVAPPPAAPESETPEPPAVAESPPKAQPPPAPPATVRSPTAILRVLDKVTAETLRFAAPVGRRVRYKTLIFMVKACETRGMKDALPRPSAYVVIDSEPPAPPGRAAPAAKEVYRGWMFADSPNLHPFEHPVYDAWLESCAAQLPPS